MKKYSTIILDLDDTLIDNTKASKYAFKVISEYLGFPIKMNYFMLFYSLIMNIGTHGNIERW